MGWRTVCAVEWADYPRKVLLARQRDGILPRFPIWDDVQTFDGKPWRGRVDVVSGGFPCQDISSAGKGKGIAGERSGMWSQMARIIGEVEPRWVLVENSPMLTSRGLGAVLRDLAEMGYDAEWGVLGAVDAGAPHKRDRIWIVAHSTRIARNERRPKSEGQLRASWVTDGSNDLADAHGELLDRSWTPREAGRFEPANSGEVGDTDRARELQQEGRKRQEWRRIGDAGWWATEPAVGRVAHGVARRVDRLRSIGNGQVPVVAALAFSILSSRFHPPAELCA